jgi:hypothetical protein
MRGPDGERLRVHWSRPIGSAVWERKKAAGTVTLVEWLAHG